MTGPLVSTGRAATYLGVSPRTVARMIDRGDLPGYRVGAHRRVPLESLPGHGRPDPTRVVPRLIGILLAARVIEDPDAALRLAARNLDRQRRRPTQSADWTDRWSDLVDRRDVAQIVEILTDPDDQTGLRQTQPFKGLITQDQRRTAFEVASG